MRVHVQVTQRHLMRGERSNTYRNPLALAIAEALGLSMVCVHQGPSTAMIADKRCSPEAYEDNVAVNLTLSRRTTGAPEVYDIRLPGQCQMFYLVFNYGHKSGPFAVETPAGRTMQTYDQIIQPFSFEIEIKEDEHANTGATAEYEYV